MKKLIWVLVLALCGWNAWLTYRIIQPDRPVNQTEHVEEETDSTVVNQTLNSYTTDMTEVMANEQSKIVGVILESEDGRSEKSGVIYSSNEVGTYILTCANSLKEAERTSVRFDNNIELEAELVGLDEVSDLAVLLVHPEFSTSTIRIGNSSVVQQGEYVIALSARNQNLGSGVGGFGIVSSKAQIYSSIENEEETEEAYLSTLVTDIVTSDIMEGGPLFNAGGDMIGMITRHLSSPVVSSRMQVALSTAEIQQIVGQLLENGEVHRYFLGVVGRNIEDIEVYEKSAYNLALDTVDGVLVTEVKEGSPASLAGIQVGDVIHSLNDTNIRNLNDLRTALYQMDFEEGLTIGITRLTGQMSLTVPKP